MPSPPRSIRTDVSTETAVSLVLVGLLAGGIAGDIVVGMLFFTLAVLAYLLYRILRTLESIAAKR